MSIPAEGPLPEDGTFSVPAEGPLLEDGTPSIPAEETLLEDGCPASTRAGAPSPRHCACKTGCAGRPAASDADAALPGGGGALGLR